MTSIQREMKEYITQQQYINRIYDTSTELGIYDTITHIICDYMVLTRKIETFQLNTLQCVFAEYKIFIFPGANFKGIDFSNLFEGCNFENTDLRYCNFENTDLRYCNFENADLRYCNFENADFTKAILNNSLTRLEL
jgi:uncharacterized protein YjbI with pentapeptide repeats